MMDSDTMVPSWLDKNFLTTLLQEDDSSKQINVLSYNTMPAVAAGNNYCSVVIRVNVAYQRNGEHVQTSLIIKTSLPDGPGKTLVEEMGIIDKECLIYKQLLPVMNKMMHNKVTPKDYFSRVPGTLILEDLKEHNYIMCDRLKQLDFDHCNMFMKVIGIFHGLSLHIHKEKPELIEDVGKELLFCDDTETKQYFTKVFITFASALEEWEDFGEFSKFIRNNVNEIWDEVISIHKEKKHLRVLNHGDAWTNNLLFKYDETGKVIDMKLIDLQLCKFASPAIDLITFLVSSAQEDVKVHRLPELYSTYLDSFNSTLKTVGSEERLTPEELQDELKFAEVLAFCIVPDFVSGVLAEKDNVLNMDKAMNAWNSPDGEGKELISKTLNGKHFKKVAKYTLNKLEEQGFLTSL